MGKRIGLSVARSVSPVALATALLAVSVPAMAAENSADQAAADQGLGEIVVTAQFRSENLQKTPIAITAVNAEMLEARSQTSIADVANQAPSVTLKPAGAGFGPALQASIRGIGQTDSSFAFEPGVGLYVDDVYYSTLTGSVLELLDLERVEVLRGPQGTLAGRNSLGGSIKLYSAVPTGSGEGYVAATVGDHGRLQLRGAADFALVPDKVMVRLSGLTNHINGYVTRYDYRCLNPGATDVPTVISGSRTDCKLGTAGGKDYSAVRGALRLVPSEKVTIDITGDYTRDNSEVQASTQTYAGPPTNPAFIAAALPGYDSRFISRDPFVSYSTFCNNKNYPGFTEVIPGGPTIVHPDGDPALAYCNPPVSRINSWGVSGKLNWNVNEAISVTSITAYRSYKAEFASDGDGSPFGLENQYYNPTHRQFTQELRLNASLGKVLDLTVGGFHMDTRSVAPGRVDAPVFGRTDFIQNDRIETKSDAAFAHAVLHPIDRVNVTGGVRYTKESKDYTYIRYVNSGAPQVSGLTNGYSGDNWDYRFAVDFEVTDQVLLYAQTSTGFKGGGAIPRPIDSSHVLPSFPYSTFKPETLKSYEAGVKTKLLDNRVRLNLAAFTSDYDGIQFEINDCGTNTFVFCIAQANVGSARIRGLEGELTAEPVPGLLIDGAASYTDFKYKSVNARTGVSLNDRALATPEWKWSLGVQYEANLGGGTLTPRIDASYQSETFYSAVNRPTSRIAGYTLWNGRVTYRPEAANWEAALEVTNLTNKLYYLNVFDTHGSLGVGYTAAQPAQPRRFAFTLKYNFK